MNSDLKTLTLEQLNSAPKKIQDLYKASVSGEKVNINNLVYLSEKYPTYFSKSFVKKVVRQKGFVTSQKEKMLNEQIRRQKELELEVLTTLLERKPKKAEVGLLKREYVKGIMNAYTLFYGEHKLGVVQIRKDLWLTFMPDAMALEVK